MNRKIVKRIIALSCAVLLVSGCGKTEDSNNIANEAGLQDEFNVSESEQAVNALSEEYTDLAGFKEKDAYTDWKDEKYEEIKFDGKNVDAGAGVKAEGAIVTITKAGTYVLSGKCDDGQVVVNADKKDDVRLVLNGLELSCTNGPVIYGASSDKIIISLENETENILTDGKKRDDEDLKAAIYSKDTIVINGSGKLTVNAKYNNGIQSKDSLRIVGGELIIDSKDDALVGKDRIAVREAKLEINAGGDGLKSKDIIVIDDISAKISAGNDGIHADIQMILNAGSVDIEKSKEGLEASEIVINGGDYNIYASDDGINAAGDTLPENSFAHNFASQEEFSSSNYFGERPDMGGKPEGERPDMGEMPEGERPDMGEMPEGERPDMGEMPEGERPDMGEMPEGERPDMGEMPEGERPDMGERTENGRLDFEERPNDGRFDMGGMQGGFGEADGYGTLVINGGNIYINSGGDGIDANDNIEMTGGTLIIEGPESNNNGAIDYGTTFIMTGGTLFAVGSSGMMQNISRSSKVESIEKRLNNVDTEGKIIKIVDKEDKTLFEFTASKKISSVVFAASELAEGEEYSVLIGDMKV